jgi:Holliday junction DNA helicase RuvA
MGFIEGIIKIKLQNSFIIQTSSGVGFQCFCSPELQMNVGERREFFLTHITKETGPELYAFDHYDQKQFFELLITVKGVGPKSAFTLTSALPMRAIADAILHENELLLKSVPGIGLKTAKQIILDLKSKIEKQDFNTHAATPSATPVTNNTVVYEARHALMGLGFKESEVLKRLSQLQGQFETSEQIVKEYLKITSDY